MATRSNIGIIRDLGTVEAIYCKWDGYPNHIGRVLLENYTTTEQVEALLELGELSILDTTLDTCIAYERDRGQVGCATKRVVGRVMRGKVTLDHSQEFVYLFDPKTTRWVYAYMGNGNGKRLS